MSNKKRLPQYYEEYEDENKLNLSNEKSYLCNNQEESIDEYDAEAIRNLLNENILLENGIMDLSLISEFVLLYTKETDYYKLIEEIFEPIDKMFPEEAHEFLTNFFSEKLNEDQWEEKLESLMEVKGNSKSFCQQSGKNSGQDKFITILKRFLLETLPIFFNAYKLMLENPLKDCEMADEYMNTFIHPILKKALIRFLGNKAIKASAYRKSVMNQNGNIDCANDIAYTSNQ
ncbi:unnamed protein product [Rhizophagus irregularis]|nr:unnamed protein product [Rhizophagus irregularis]CAB5358451.1 unnamed protein product [Rhizophagus irregularis]